MFQYRTPYEAPMLIAVCFLLTFLGTVALLARFSTRRQSKVRVPVEDWLLIPALVLEYAIAGLILWGCFTRAFGYPIPPPNVPGPMGFALSMSPEQEKFMKIQFIIWPMHSVCTGLVKVSILLFYKHIFCPSASVNHKFGIALKVFMAIIAVWTTGFCIGFISQCNPSSQWGTVVEINEKCPYSDDLVFASTIFSFVSDLFIAALPMPKIWSLHMQVRQKWAVTAVMMIGLIAVAASVVRLVNLAIIWQGLWVFPDGEYIATTMVTWTMVEVGVAMITACLLTLSPLLRKLSAAGIVRSIRSTLSSLSLGSGRSRNSSFDSERKGPSSNGSAIEVRTELKQEFAYARSNEPVGVHSTAV